MVNTDGKSPAVGKVDIAAQIMQMMGKVFLSVTACTLTPSQSLSFDEFVVGY